jgi:hypothetical protein
MSIPSPTQLATMWNSKYSELQETRLRVRLCRDWLAQKTDPVVPKAFAEVAGDLAVKLPDSTAIPLHAVQMLSSQRPRLHRDPMGKSINSRTNASDLEMWANAAIQAIEDQHGKFWRPLMDMLFNQSCGAVLCFPATAGWEDFPAFVDEDSGVVPMYAKMPTMRQAARSYDDYLLDWKARQVPIGIRVIGIDQSIPIFGPQHRLDGLIIRSQHKIDDLAPNGYHWRFADSGHVGPGYDPQLATGPSRGLYPTFTLYELWQPGRVVYYVANSAVGAGAISPENLQLGLWGTPNGGTAEAVVDLTADFGITRMCGIWAWGCNFASEPDPDRRGVPFLWPFLSSFQGINNLATAELAHVWQTGFGGWFIPANADVTPDLVLENGRPRQIEIKPMTAQYVAGVPVPATHPGTNKDVNQLLALMQASIQREAPSAAAGGGPGATSGHDRALIRAMLQDAYDDVLQGGLEAFRFVGSMVTEIADRIAEYYDTTVPVYCAVQPKGMRQSVRVAQELTTEMTSGVYDFTADYPPEEGANLPYAQMLMSWAQEGLLPLRQALEKGMADENPDETMIEIQTENLLFKTPQGQQYLFQLAAKKLGDAQMASLFQAVQKGTAAPDGTPTAALPGGGQPPGGPGQSSLQGVQTPNPVASALGGIIQGGIGAQNMRRDALATMMAGRLNTPPAGGPPA